MDPTRTLERIRELTEYMLELNVEMELEDVADELSTCIQALDEWLSQGGFLPEQWKKEHR